MKSVMTQLLEKGEEKGIGKVAKTMLDKGFNVSEITEATNLSEAQISKLKSEIERD